MLREIEKSRSVTDKYVNFIREIRCQSKEIDEIRHEISDIWVEISG